MTRVRERRTEKGMVQVTLWVSQEQHELLSRIAEDLNCSLSDAAQLLIYKNSKQLIQLGIL